MPEPETRQRSVQWSPTVTMAEAKPVPPSSWAKKTGFKPKFSGETNAGDSGQITLPPIKSREAEATSDLEAGRVRALPPPAVANGVAQGEKVPPLPPPKDFVAKKRRDSDGVPTANGQVKVEQPVRRTVRKEEVGGSLPLSVDEDGFVLRHSHMKYELRDSPGLGKDNNSIIISITPMLLMDTNTCDCIQFLKLLQMLVDVSVLHR